MTIKPILDIRRLTPDDATIYRRLRIEASSDPAFASNPAIEAAISVELLRKTLENPGGGEVLGAFEAGSLVGIIGLGSSEAHQVGTLFGLFIVPERRGKGYGKALVRSIVERASNASNLDSLELSVDSSNTIAKALYETLGFTTVADRLDATLRMRLCF